MIKKVMRGFFFGSSGIGGCYAEYDIWPAWLLMPGPIVMTSRVRIAGF